MIRTPLCDILNIEYPVLQGGMAWIADGELAAAVSNGGGLGIIAAGNAPGDYVREEIRKAAALTDKPFGVNIMLLSPFVDEVAQVVAEEKVAVVTTGAGNPSKYMKGWLEAGIKVIPVVPSVAMAKLMTRICATALIAEGGESGGDSVVIEADQLAGFGVHGGGAVIEGFHGQGGDIGLVDQDRGDHVGGFLAQVGVVHAVA